MGKTDAADPNDGDILDAGVDGVDELFTDLDGTPDPLDRSVNVNDLLTTAGKDRSDGIDGKERVRKADATGLGAAELRVEGEEGFEAGEGDEAGEGSEADGADEGQETPPDERDLEILNLRREKRQSDLRAIEIEAAGLENHENQAKGAKQNAENVLKDWKARLVKAKEDGNSIEEANILEQANGAQETLRVANDALLRIEARRGELRNDLAKMGFDPKEGKFKDDVPAGDGKTGAGKTAKSVTPQTKVFMQKNAWMRDPKHTTSAQLLVSMDRDLAADDKWKDKVGSDGYLKELSARFNRVKPGLVRDAAGKLIGTGAQRRGANGSGGAGTVGTGRSQETGKVNPRDVKLDRSDLVTMKNYGLDPDVPAHRAQWLMEKRAMTVREVGRA